MPESDAYPPVGFPPIDEDHREIAIALGRLVRAVKDDNNEMCVVLANTLVDTTIAHFAREERLMKEIGFPFFDRHKRTHEVFLAKAQLRLEELRTRGMTADCLRWCAETIEWFGSHVRTEDLALGHALLTHAGSDR